jgi:hypothetical protein
LKRHRLLEPLVAALEQLDGRSYDDMRLIFTEVARRRPDLLERSLFSERSRRTTEIEKVLLKTIAEIDTMVSTGSLPDGLAAPFLSHLRFNHSNGRLHIGHGSQSTLLFSEDTRS